MPKKILLNWRMVRTFKLLFYLLILPPLLLVPYIGIPAFLLICLFRVRIYESGVKLPFRRIVEWKKIKSYRPRDTVLGYYFDFEKIPRGKIHLLIPKSLVLRFQKILNKKKIRLS